MWGYYKKNSKVSDLKMKAEKEAIKLAKSLGRELNPAVSKGRKIADSYWGFAWCQHLEKYMDYDNRLPRGRSYVKNGCVIDLQIEKGLISAYVSGSELYEVNLHVDTIDEEAWNGIKEKCAGSIDSTVALLSGSISDEVMAVVSDPKHGLFPQSNQIRLICNCPDWANMCKHVAAVLYGVGARFDNDPGLLFILRGVSPDELVDSAMDDIANIQSGSDELAGQNLGDLFGVEMDAEDIDVDGLFEDESKKVKKTKTPKAKKKATKPAKNKPAKKAKKTIPRKKVAKKTVKKVVKPKFLS